MLDANFKKDNLIQNNHEMVQKSVAVWLIIKDGLSSGKIALQKRSSNSGQSHAGVCQPTWNGKLEEGESLIDAIKREAKEELGEGFYNTFDFSKLTQCGFDSFEFKGQKFISYNFAGSISEAQLKTVKMHEQSSPEFVFVGKEDLEKIKSKNDPLANLDKNVVLFDDQYRFLIKFLQSSQYRALL